MARCVDRSGRPGLASPNAVISRTIKGIVFDVGETLLCFGPLDTRSLFNEAARRSYDCLCALGAEVGSFRRYYWKSLFGLRWHLLRTFLTGRDFDALDLLQQVGRKRGLHLTEDQWRQVHWCWYEPLYKVTRVEPDLQDTIRTLAERYKLGILSNTFVHASAIERHLDELGVLDYFPVRLWSYDFAFRKPDRRIFIEAAQRLGEPPEALVYIGDRIDKDVKGALAAGMIPVLKQAHTNGRGAPPAGTVRIERLAQLPDRLGEIESRT